MTFSKEKFFSEIINSKTLEQVVRNFSNAFNKLIKSTDLNLFLTLNQESVLHLKHKEDMFDNLGYTNSLEKNLFEILLTTIQGKNFEHISKETLLKTEYLKNLIEGENFFVLKLNYHEKELGLAIFSISTSKIKLELDEKFLLDFATLFSICISNFLFLSNSLKASPQKEKTKKVSIDSDKFKFLFDVVSSFNYVVDYNQASQTVIEKSAEVIAVSDGYFISLDLGKYGYGRVIASVDKKSPYLNSKIQLSDNFKTFVQNKDYIIYEPSMTHLFQCLDLKYAILFPIYFKNEIKAVVCLGEKKLNLIRAFQEDEIKLIKALLSQAVITLENTKMYNKMEDIVIERTVELIDSNKELKRQKEKLEILSLKLQSVISSIPDGILVINNNNKIVNLNTAFENIFSYCATASQKIETNTHLSDLLTMINYKNDKIKKSFTSLIDEIISKTSLDYFETDFIIEDITPHYYKVLIAPISTINVLEKEREYSASRVIVFHDITKEKELDKLKSDFMAVVSHELKTPVSAMMGFASLLEDGIGGDISELQGDFLQKIQLQGERLLRLINDLLDFSKLEAGQMPMYFQLLHPEEVVVEVVEMLRPLVEEKNMEIRINVDENLSLIYIDPDKLKQILINLIGNAIKFTPEGTGLIEITIKNTNNNYVFFSIKDNGIGIDEKSKKRLFEKFYQADNSSTRKYSGTGLGLAIAKKLVDLNKGNIWVDSEIGKGSSFCFTIPVHEQN